MQYSINRLIKFEQNTLKKADRIMPNYLTGMDILPAQFLSLTLLLLVVDKNLPHTAKIQIADETAFWLN